MSDGEAKVLFGSEFAARFLGLAVSTVRKYARRKVLPSVRGKGIGDYLFTMEDLQKLKDLLDGGWKPSFKH